MMEKIGVVTKKIFLCRGLHVDQHVGLKHLDQHVDVVDMLINMFV